MKPLLKFIATMGPVGYFPVAPATAGSAVVVAVGWFLPVPALPMTIACLVVGTFLAVWICGEAEKELGHDAHPIVADEVVGQSIALLFVPHVWWAFLASFVLFRVFDVWKPLGANQAQKLPGGWGVVMDDVLAGIIACGVFHLGWWGLRALGS